MGELGQRAVALRPHYGVVIVGSGYGGAVMAARLAQAGVDVCVLERGVEWPAGRFPETQAGFAAATALVTSRATLGRSDALFRFQVGAQYSALTGSGLGGTSLINAGVVLRPSNERLEAVLPSGVLGAALERGFERSYAELSPRTLPNPVTRSAALSRRAARVGQPFEPVPLAVAFEPQVNAAGVALKPCNACGNCITGCNVGAKGSLDRNYLPLAVKHGASLFTGVDVQRVVERAGGLGLFLKLHTLDRERFEDTELFVTAEVVVLAAGSLGSTEVLWRSREAGLPVPASLGERFSGNGTVLAFTHRLDEPLEALGESSSRARGVVGPTLTGMFDWRDSAQPMVVQDTAIPRPLVPFIQAAMGTRGRELVGWSVTAGDEAGGRLVLDRGRLRIDWPGAGRGERHLGVEAALKALSTQLGGAHRGNPASVLPGNPLITTHPLGGCAMGSVLDADHRVRRGDSASVHEGLYVVDGSVFSGALGTNPLWTISALAERCAERLLEQHPRLSRARPAVAPVARADAVRFTERMAGWLSPVASPCPPPSPRAVGAVSLSFLLTVEWPSMTALQREPSVWAASVGTVRCPMLSPHPLTVTQGSFQLFVETAAGTRMKHDLTLRSVEGVRYRLVGHKEICDDPGFDVVFDTRTLFIRVTRLEGEAEVLVGHGVVQTGPLDLATQVQTIKGVGQPLSGDLRTRVAFLHTFLRGVQREYFPWLSGQRAPTASVAASVERG